MTLKENATFYVVVIKQIQIPVGEWELVYDCSPDEPIIEEVIYFAVCDVLAYFTGDMKLSEDDCFYGVILPISVGDEGNSLEPVLTKEWVTPKEQKISLRHKETPAIASNGD